VRREELWRKAGREEGRGSEVRSSEGGREGEVELTPVEGRFFDSKAGSEIVCWAHGWDGMGWKGEG